MLLSKTKKLFFIIVLISNHAVFALQVSDYDLAVRHSALHQASISPSLLTTIQGTMVRMVVFTTYANYKTSDKTLGATIWTTVEPEVKKLCTQYVRENKNKLTRPQLSLWLVQLLGLPEANADKRFFVILDVPVIQAYYGSASRDIGIFRPCTDPRIGIHYDGSEICPKQMNPSDFNISSEYKTWFINNSISSYSAKNGAPWTEYGYTYNWNPSARSVYGVAEFVVLKTTPVTVRANPNDITTAYVTPEQYCGVN